MLFLLLVATGVIVLKEMHLLVLRALVVLS